MRADGATVRRAGERTRSSRRSPRRCEPCDLARPRSRRAPVRARRRAPTLAGWVARRRDHGGLVFIDLRDSTGISQLVVNPGRSPEAAAAAHDIRNEFVLRATGEVAARAPENVNPNLPTGEVELQVDELDVVSTSPPLPFQLDEENVDETLRFRYRWLDLRRDALQRNIRTRAKLVSIIRQEMEAEASSTSRRRSWASRRPRGPRLPGADATPAGQVLRAPPVAADLQAAARDLRVRALLPDRPLLPGRGSPRRPAPGADAARRRDGLPGPGVHPRADRADRRADLARDDRRRARSRRSADVVAGG